MLFHITYEFDPADREEAQARFKDTGALPPAGVEMLGRWHAVAGQLGFIIAESSDGEAIGQWMQDWTDLLAFDVTPVLTDEQIARVIG
jgi:hypothetical protein